MVSFFRAKAHHGADVARCWCVLIDAGLIGYNQGEYVNGTDGMVLCPDLAEAFLQH